MQKQAQIDAYLDWHHGNIRVGAAMYMFRKYVSGFMDKDGIFASEFAIQDSWETLQKSLRIIEKVWLPRGQKKKFMFGDEPSIADISLSVELANLVEIENFPLLEKHPSIHKWLYEDMMSVPGYKPLHDRTMKHISPFFAALKVQRKERELEAKSRAKM
jgi:glutathione S-transferase